MTSGSSGAEKRQKELRSALASMIPPGSKYTRASLLDKEKLFHCYLDPNLPTMPPVIRISQRESAYLRYSSVLPAASSLDEIASKLSLSIDDR